MKMTQWFLSELDAEARRTRRALENVPEGRDDWKPHDRSMPLGRLAMLVAQMPSWISLVVDKDELDLQPPGGGSNVDTKPLRTAAELTAAHDRNVEAARRSLTETRGVNAVMSASSASMSRESVLSSTYAVICTGVTRRSR